MKPSDYGAPGQFCVSCEHFSRSDYRAKTRSEWGTCLVTKKDVHELEENLPCHSSRHLIVVVKADAVDQDTSDLDEARRWVREHIERGASLPPHEVAYMVGIKAGRAQVGGSQDEGVAWLERRLQNMRDLVKSQEAELARLRKLEEKNP